jgi:hypothetical protein
MLRRRQNLPNYSREVGLWTLIGDAANVSRAIRKLDVHTNPLS